VPAPCVSGAASVHFLSSGVVGVPPLLSGAPWRKSSKLTPAGGGASTAARDITDRRNAEEELRQVAAELKRSNEALAQFAYVASHDLHEPLRMVASFVQLIAQRYKGKLDAQGDEYIAYAVDGAQRMQALIHDLLDLSRLQTRANPMRPTDCAAVLQNVETDLQLAITEAGAVITHDALPTVLADSTQLAQLWQNLLMLPPCVGSPPVCRVESGAHHRPENDAGGHFLQQDDQEFLG